MGIEEKAIKILFHSEDKVIQIDRHEVCTSFSGLGVKLILQSDKRMELNGVGSLTGAQYAQML